MAVTNSMFRCGAFAVPAGADHFDVVGLGLPFEPKSVVVSMRQPAADSDILSAFVSGSPSQDGFSVVLSAPAGGGYVLDWQAFSDEIVVTDADSLAVSYRDLCDTVARFLGYDPANLTDLQTSEVDQHVQAGVRNFYYPPKSQIVDERFEWSFLRQRGSIVTTPGVSRYALPNGFGRMLGNLSYPVEMHVCDIPLVPYGDIGRVKGWRDIGLPRFAAVLSRNAFGTKGQLKELHLAPTPDVAVEISFLCDADTGRLSDENPYPLGGHIYSELVTESCLAVAEQRSNDEVGIHTQNFNALLASMVAKDGRSYARAYGRIGDPVSGLGEGW